MANCCDCRDPPGEDGCSSEVVWGSAAAEAPRAPLPPRGRQAVLGKRPKEK